MNDFSDDADDADDDWDYDVDDGRDDVDCDDDDDDSDGDGSCDSDDVCPLDPENDADADGIFRITKKNGDVIEQRVLRKDLPIYFYYHTNGKIYGLEGGVKLLGQ